MKETWIEEKRPKNFNELVSHKEAIQVVKGFIKDELEGNENMPHMIFYGPAGTGKTSIAKIIVKEYFIDVGGSSGMLMELNASKERSVSVVREKVGGFIGASSVYPNKRRCVILDEVDYWDELPQATLRRMMEDYVDNAFFILICNYLSKIISPIVSRCADFNFRPLKDNEIKAILMKICIEEDINLSESNMNKIVKYSMGDARSALNYLHTLKNNEEIDLEAIIGSSNIGAIKQIVVNTIKGQIQSAVNLGVKFIENSDIKTFCNYLFDTMRRVKGIPEKVKYKYILNHLYDVDKSSQLLNPKIGVVKLIVGLDELLKTNGGLNAY